jgi:hypothetical protein
MMKVIENFIPALKMPLKTGKIVMLSWPSLQKEIRRLVTQRPNLTIWQLCSLPDTIAEQVA